MKRQSNTRLLTHLDDFDPDNFFDSFMSDTQKHGAVNESIVDQELTVGNSDGNPAVNEKLMNVKTLGTCFNERIDRKIGNFVHTAD